MKVHKDVEIWRDIPNYEGRYFVSNKGRVKSVLYVHNRGYNSHYKSNIIKAHKYSNGYSFVALSMDGVVKQYLLHRLVMKAFIGESNLEVNHKDGNKDNNSLDNLEYVTHQENQLHAFRILKRAPAKSWLGKKGFNHNKSKAVKLEDITNGECLIFGSMREAESHGYNRSTIAKSIKHNLIYRNKYKVSYL